MREMLGGSATGLRIYTTTYPDYLSTEATGKRRKFTEADLCFLSYVKTRTDIGDNHREPMSREKKKACFSPSAPIVLESAIVHHREPPATVRD